MLVTTKNKGEKTMDNNKQKKQTVTTWIKNHQKTAGVLGLVMLGAFMTGMYVVTGIIGGHYDPEV